MTDTKAKLTIPDLAARKAAGERLVMVAVGEVLTATWAERAGVDIVGVGVITDDCRVEGRAGAIPGTGAQTQQQVIDRVVVFTEQSDALFFLDGPEVERHHQAVRRVPDDTDRRIG